jgi:general stress protein 26
MADYGVPTDPSDAMPFEWARERLQANRNYWIVTVDTHGRPHSTPVWGVWRDDDTFWFSCAPTAFKARNLRTNPAVAITTTDTVEFVSVEGMAAEATPPPDVSREWAVKYGDDNDRDNPDQAVAEMAEFFASNAAFQVRPTKAIGMIEREEEFATKATRWVWDA